MDDKIVEINKGHYHEIADRGFTILGLIDDILIDHPGMTKEMNELCEEAQGLIYRVVNQASELEGQWDTFIECSKCKILCPPDFIYLKTKECLDCMNKDFRNSEEKCITCDEPLPCKLICEK